VDLSQLDHITVYLLDYWWVALPLAIFLLVGHKLAPKIIISLFGFYGGITLIVPMLKGFEKFRSFIEAHPNVEMGVYLLIGLIMAALLYTLYRTAIIVLGFLGGGMLGIGVWYVVGLVAPQLYEKIPVDDIYVELVFFGIFGLIGAVVAAKRDEAVSSALALIAGAGGVAFILVGLFQIYVLKLKEPSLTPLTVFAILCIFVGLLLCVSWITGRVRARKIKINTSGEEG